jgi:hypothetical protein
MLKVSTLVFRGQVTQPPSEVEFNSKQTIGHKPSDGTITNEL